MKCLYTLDIKQKERIEFNIQSVLLLSDLFITLKGNIFSVNRKNVFRHINLLFQINTIIYETIRIIAHPISAYRSVIKCNLNISTYFFYILDFNIEIWQINIKMKTVINCFILRNFKVFSVNFLAISHNNHIGRSRL